MFRFVTVFLVVCLFFLTPGVAKAQTVKPKKADTTALRQDSSSITAAKFNRDAIRDYKDQKAFQYDEAKAQQLSLWDSFWMWFWQQIGRLFNGAATNSFTRFLIIAGGIGLVIFILIRVIGAESLFSKKSVKTILPYDVITENIHEIDYEQELKRLVTEGKYRLAVRLLYLQTLKKLSDKEIIDWKPGKTNFNYLSEISQPELKSGFSQLTMQFDYIWYGDFPIDSIKFEPLNQMFNQFKAQIK